MSSDENYKKRQFLERELQEISKKKLKNSLGYFRFDFRSFFITFFPNEKIN